MKIELNYNGYYTLKLVPTSELEKMFLNDMSERAEKGVKVEFKRLITQTDWEYSLIVEK